MTNTPNQKLLDVLKAYPNLSLGTDISRHQEDVDFATMKKRKVHFAAFRTSIGNYYVDPMREVYFLNASAAGIHQTDYHVVRPDNSAVSQMNNYFSSRPTGDNPPAWPMVLDNEIHGKSVQVKINKKKYKWVYKKFPTSQITDRLLECKEIVLERDGIMPIHYSYLYFLLDRLEDTPEIWEMDLWLAHFRTLRPGWISGRNKLATLNSGKGVEIVLWQCLVDGDDQGPYFGSGSHGLDIDLFMLGDDKEFDRRYIAEESPREPEEDDLKKGYILGFEAGKKKTLENGIQALEDLK